MRLVRVELSRFFSRRAVALLLVAAALLAALVAGTTIWNTRPVGADGLARAQAQAAQMADQPRYANEIETCQEDPKQYFGPEGTAADCKQQLTPSAEDFLSRRALSLAEQRDEGGLGLLVIVTALMVIVGATFAGADWATGSMSNQLLFEPRRLRVWTSKAVAATLGCLLVSVVVVSGFWVALYLVAESRGIPTAGGTLRGIGWMSGRGVLLATAAGLGGYALTMLLRSTVATIAVLFAYAAGGEALLALAPMERSGLWSASNNVFAWIRNGVRVYDGSIVCAPGQACDQQLTVSLAHGAAYLGVLLVVTLMASAFTFRRRDIP
jgi:ABC-2 type transport system permease protein